MDKPKPSYEQIKEVHLNNLPEIFPFCMFHFPRASQFIILPFSTLCIFNTLLWPYSTNSTLRTPRFPSSSHPAGVLSKPKIKSDY